MKKSARKFRTVKVRKPRLTAVELNHHKALFECHDKIVHLIGDLRIANNRADEYAAQLIEVKIHLARREGYIDRIHTVENRPLIGVLQPATMTDAAILPGELNWENDFGRCDR